MSPALLWLLLCIWWFGGRKFAKSPAHLCYKIDFSNIKFVGSRAIQLRPVSSCRASLYLKAGEQAEKEADRCQDDFYWLILIWIEEVPKNLHPESEPCIGLFMGRSWRWNSGFNNYGNYSAPWVITAYHQHFPQYFAHQFSVFDSLDKWYAWATDRGLCPGKMVFFVCLYRVGWTPKLHSNKQKKKSYCTFRYLYKGKYVHDPHYEA